MTRIDITPDITAGHDDARFEHGLVFGKFMPPTNGHLYLIDFARRSCKKLTIVVLTLENEPIEGHLRYQWVKEIFPDCTVVHHDHDMPQEPRDAHDVPFYHAWRDTLRKHCPDNSFDALFASESYGYQVAWALGIPFVPVDTRRTSVRISGTAMRADAWMHWQHLHPVVRPYFLRHVALCGGTADMRGRLAAQLAGHYQTSFVPDYGSSFAADLARNIPGWHAKDLTLQDISTIARGQQASAQALARQAWRVLFHATTLHDIAAQSGQLFGQTPAWVAQAAASEKTDILLALPGAAADTPAQALELPDASLQSALRVLSGHLPAAATTLKYRMPANTEESHGQTTVFQTDFYNGDRGDRDRPHAAGQPWEDRPVKTV